MSGYPEDSLELLAPELHTLDPDKFLIHVSSLHQP